KDDRFVIAFEGANGFEVAPPRVDAGEMTANSDPRKFELVVYSPTRGPDRAGPGEPGDLASPKIDVRAPSGGSGEPPPLLTVTPPVRVPQEELGTLTANLFRH